MVNIRTFFAIKSRIDGIAASAGYYENHVYADIKNLPLDAEPSERRVDHERIDEHSHRHYKRGEVGPYPAHYHGGEQGFESRQYHERCDRIAEQKRRIIADDGIVGLQFAYYVQCQHGAYEHAQEQQRIVESFELRYHCTPVLIMNENRDAINIPYEFICRQFAGYCIWFGFVINLRHENKSTFRLSGQYLPFSCG